MNEQTTGTLPDDFDGVFRFTNFTDDEFTAQWGGEAYTFAPQSTTPIVVPTSSPIEIQSIRKKFAKDLAVIEFYKSEKFKLMNAHVPGGVPALYTESDLAPLIQRCLEPLPPARAKVTPLPKEDESKFKTDNKGRKVTKVLEKDESLIGDSGEVVA